MKSCIIWCKKKNSDFFWKKDFTVAALTTQCAFLCSTKNLTFLAVLGVNDFWFLKMIFFFQVFSFLSPWENVAFSSPGRHINCRFSYYIKLKLSNRFIYLEARVIVKRELLIDLVSHYLKLNTTTLEQTDCLLHVIHNRKYYTLRFTNILTLKRLEN